MPFDALFMSGVVGELSKTLTGARLNKIQQPARDELLLHMHGPNGSGRLLISIATGAARLHMTELPCENAPTPPMFCMVLRKHLSGGRLLALEQIPGERVVTLTFSSLDEMGEMRQRKLVCELMGRLSNVILVDEDGRILDCMRKVDFEMSQKRQVLPGLFYHLPPAPDKVNFLEAATADLAALLQESGGKPLDRLLLDGFSGLSPLVCRELAFLSTGQVDKPADALTEHEQNALIKQFTALQGAVQAQNFQPCLLSGADGALKDYSFLPVTHYGSLYSLTEFRSFSKLLDTFYHAQITTSALEQKRKYWRKTLQQQIDRLNRKLTLQESELEQTKDRESLRRLGDIVNACIGQIPKGATQVELPDFYGEEGATITIKLDPALSPQQNAARFYKEYTKLKSAEAHLSHLIAQGKEELSYLYTVADALDRSDDLKTIDEIAQELTDHKTGRNTTPEKGRKKGTSRPSAPLSFTLHGGFTVWVGRNNRQNDQLTFYTADKKDYWFHVKDRPGSHVILSCRSGEPEPEVLQQAADLAALYSSAAQGDKIPVDYTRVRFVKKTPGGKPGMVIYNKYKTLLGSPDRAKKEHKL
ncbi:MAG TPA: fibronectin/fibrinogen-binding protein [Clostridiales bacterium]|nr:fibronectin/fibrinogen-binding protein [Clostridiales bacterium]